MDSTHKLDYPVIIFVVHVCTMYADFATIEFKVTYLQSDGLAAAAKTVTHLILIALQSL